VQKPGLYSFKPRARYKQSPAVAAGLWPQRALKGVNIPLRRWENSPGAGRFLHAPQNRVRL
jgi:hypothetical protein